MDFLVSTSVHIMAPHIQALKPCSIFGTAVVSGAFRTPSLHGVRGRSSASQKARASAALLNVEMMNYGKSQDFLLSVIYPLAVKWRVVLPRPIARFRDAKAIVCFADR